MVQRRLGSTGVHRSAVGSGTRQLRRVPEEQALATLRRGFEPGVNRVHVSPDSCGAEEPVGEAIRVSGRRAMPVSDCSSAVQHFEHLIERACRIFETRRLDVRDISPNDDPEFVENDVWGPGVVARKKRETTSVSAGRRHQPPGLARLVTRRLHADAERRPSATGVAQRLTVMVTPAQGCGARHLVAQAEHLRRRGDAAALEEAREETAAVRSILKEAGRDRAGERP